MAINNTSILKLRQITYMHDGEESADAFNETMTILDAIFTYFISNRSMSINESAMGYVPVGNLTSLTPNGPNTSVSTAVILDRTTGEPILNRLALPY